MECDKAKARRCCCLPGRTPRHTAPLWLPRSNNAATAPWQPSTPCTHRQSEAPMAERCGTNPGPTEAPPTRTRRSVAGKEEQPVRPRQRTKGHGTACGSAARRQAHGKALGKLRVGPQRPDTGATDWTPSVLIRYRVANSSPKELSHQIATAFVRIHGLLMVMNVR
jgi:hypothetical protein